MEDKLSSAQAMWALQEEALPRLQARHPACAAGYKRWRLQVASTHTPGQWGDGEAERAAEEGDRGHGAGTGKGTHSSQGVPRWPSVRGDPLLFCEVLECTGQGIPLKCHVFCIFVFAGSSQEMGYGFFVPSMVK